MIFQENISLAQYTTFKIGGSARFFCLVASIDELKEAFEFAQKKSVPFFVLGGGSNLLISDEGFHGLVIKMEIRGKKIGDRSQKLEVATVSAGAGEMWDEFVEWTLVNGFNGLENLSAIPGTVGAAPVQNIGAYGTEVGQFISTVHAFDTHTMKEIELNARDCHFGYRNSMFKHEKGRYIITHVDFALRNDGKVNVEYKDLRNYFNDQVTITNSQITPLQVREAVIDIRWNKLPDWNTWGTAGSFFKNPIVTQEKFDELKVKYPGMPSFPEASGGIKIPLGWILDNVCQLKGVMTGGVGTYEKQALVIITKPGAKALEVVAFTQDLMKQVKEATGIMIEAEVEWVN
ncbi:MAG: UDP-N-acetylmuramate dehydrogenase [Candidatus Pacebacteria bacterium]|nr:UDP-N-acetylmuramate dehydrogenase [Candidatus Paceibacterota bacterium]